MLLCLRSFGVVGSSAWGQRVCLLCLLCFSQLKTKPRRPTTNPKRPTEATPTNLTKKAINPNFIIMEFSLFNPPIETMASSQIWAAKIGAIVIILLYGLPLFVLLGAKILLYFRSREALLISNGCWRKAKKPKPNQRFRTPKKPVIFKPKSTNVWIQ